MEVSLGLALLSGIASTLSPCVLPVLPTFLGWLTGVAAKDDTISRRRIYDRLGWFVLGLVATFVLSGAAAGSIGAVLRQMTWIVPAAGVVFILWGLFLLGALRMPHMRVRLPKAEQTGRLGAVLFGLLFTITWTPCIGPIYGTILTLAASTGSAAQGATLLFAYAIGLAIPLVLVGLAASRAIGPLRRLAGAQRIFRIISGAIVLVIGLLLVTGLYTRLIGFVNGWFAGYVPPLA